MSRRPSTPHASPDPSSEGDGSAPSPKPRSRRRKQLDASPGAVDAIAVDAIAAARLVLLDRRVDWFQVAYRVAIDHSEFASESEWTLVATDGEGRRRFERPDGTAIVVGAAGKRAGLGVLGHVDPVTGEVRDVDVDDVDAIKACDPMHAARVRGARRVVDQGDRAVSRYLHQRAKLARRHGRARVTLGPLVDGMMRAPARAGVYLIQAKDYAIKIDVHARARAVGGGTRPGFNVTIEWRAVSLAERGFDLHVSRAMASAFGRVMEQRMVRTDLAATFAGWTIRDSDRRGLVHRSRAKPDRFYVLESDDPANDTRAADPSAKASGPFRKGPPGRRRRRRRWVDVRAHGAQKCTGFTVGMGGDLSCRVYDKLQELLTKGQIRRVETRVFCTSRPGGAEGKGPPRKAVHYVPRTKKGEAELRAWAEAGVDLAAVTWAVAPPITRVEFQLRGAVLDEFAMRAPESVAGRLDPVWRYCVGVDGDPKARGWLRMVLPDSDPKPTRRKIDPRWSAVRAVTWESADRGVAQRVKRPVGAGHWKQGLGVIVSTLAEDHKLDHLPPRFANGREEDVRKVHPAIAQRITEEYVTKACAKFARHCIESLAAEKGTHGAAEYVLTRWGAGHSRFKRERWADWVDKEIERRVGNRTGDEAKWYRMMAMEQYGRLPIGTAVAWARARKPRLPRPPMSPALQRRAAELRAETEAHEARQRTGTGG